MNNIKEVWMPIVGFEGYYEISSLGRVRSVDRVIESFKDKSKTKFLINLKGKLRPFSMRSDYKQIVLFKNGKGKTITIHRLVATAFIPNPNNLPCINHIDGDKLNNNTDNLEWCSYSDNNKHAIKTGLIINHKKRLEKMWSATRRKVIDTVTLVVFNSIREASIVTGIDERYLAAMLRGSCTNKTNFKYYD